MESSVVAITLFIAVFIIIVATVVLVIYIGFRKIEANALSGLEQLAREKLAPLSGKTFEEIESQLSPCIEEIL